MMRSINVLLTYLLTYLLNLQCVAVVTSSSVIVIVLLLKKVGKFDFTTSVKVRGSDDVYLLCTSDFGSDADK